MEIPGPVLEIAAQRECDLSLSGQPRRVEAILAGYGADRRVDHLQDLTGVADRLAVDIDALVRRRQPRDLHQPLGQPDSLDGGRLHLHAELIPEQRARPARRVDHRHAIGSQDVGAVIGEGQADLVLADGPAGGHAAGRQAEAEHRPADAADSNVVADPVTRIGTLLLGPQRDDGLGAHHPGQGGVHDQTPGAQSAGPLKLRVDQERRSVELQVHAAQVDVANLRRVAGAEGEPANLGGRRAGIEG